MMSRNSEEKSDCDPGALTARSTAIVSAAEGSLSGSGASWELTACSNRNFSRNLLLSKFWQGGKNASVIYENVCNGCGYGIFEAEGRLCDFCRYAINGQIKDTANIYENICEQCGEIYNSDECETCLLARLEAEKPAKRIPPSKPAANRIFSGLFGSLKKARSREKSTKYRKLEIIHNVDGYSNVFRTNETFDLNRICELKRLHYKSEQHIYGKLRKSDDHLMNSLKFERTASNNNSKSDPSLHKISSATRSQQLPIITTKTLTLDKSSSNECDKETKPPRSYFILQDHVIHWMTSLRSQTHDYYTQSPDDSICNTKSIPSRNFNCCGPQYDLPYRHIEDISLRSLLVTATAANDLNFDHMIENFKRNLMEKQRSKRRAIYVKVDDKVDDDRNVRTSKRNALYEKDSDFVNDMLSAFDSFLNCDGDRHYHDGKTSSGTNGPEVQCDSAIDVHNSSGKTRESTALVVVAIVNKSPQQSRTQCRVEILKTLFNSSKVLVKRVKLRGVVTTIELSKSLNRSLITYDRLLSAFLSAIDKQCFKKLDRDRKMKIYGTITALDRSAFARSADRTLVIPPNQPHPAITVSVPTPIEEDIYQPIWKFQTAGNPRESYLSDSYDVTAEASNDSSESEDHSDWETDDEFMFSPNHQQQQLDQQRQKKSGSNYAPTAPTASISSETPLETVVAVGSSRSLYSNHSDSDKSEISESKYQSICVLFSLDEPKLRAIIYNYDRRRSYFAGHHHSKYRQDRSGCETIISKSSLDQEIVRVNGSKKIVTTTTKTTTNSESNKTATNSIPDCVQAWKFMLLDINYLDDEEDMYVTKDEILNKYKEIDPIPVTTLKKSASEGNLLSIPPDKKKSLGERVISKFHAVGFLNINPRHPKDKKGKVFSKRPESTGIYLDGTVNNYPIFGATLTQVEYSRNYNVPRFVVDCIKIIEQPDLIRTDGLYRASGNKVEIDVVKKCLKERYDEKVLITQDIHTVTGLLKQFFRELKTPLISDEIYNKLPAENLADKDNLSTIKEILQQMPCQPKDTLKFLLKHLTVVAEVSSINRMPASNLAIIWGPCILYSSFTNPMSIARINTLTKVLIENFNVIFNEDERLIS